MDTRVVLLGIIVENTAAVEELNAILHNYGSYIIGRMGLPYREKNLHIISIVLDAPQNIIAEHYQRACRKNRHAAGSYGQSALCRKTGLVLNALGLFYRRNTDREGSS